jgi:rhodanese-related sulfurtransferase
MAISISKYSLNLRDRLRFVAGASVYPIIRAAVPLAKHCLKRPATLVLPVLLLMAVMLGSGCSNTDSGAASQTVTEGQINKFVTLKQASDLIQKNQDNPDFIIIDDRVPELYRTGHIANAINIPYGPDFSARIGKIDKNKVYLVYCPSGCGSTSKAMKQLGFREVYEISGGLNAWKSEGLPIE